MNAGHVCSAVSELESAPNYGAQTSKPLTLGWLGNAIAYRLRIAQDLSFQRYKEQLREFSSLHPGQFTALAVIAANPGCNQTELGLAIGRDKSTLTPLLAGLERQKLLVRTRRTDNQRTYSLKLTPRGEALLQSLERVARDHEQAISEIFTAEEKVALLDYLNRMIELVR